MLVCATNGYSAGLAAVSVFDTDGLTADAETDAFSLVPGAVKHLLGLFPAGKTEEGDMGECLRFTLTGDDLRVLDVSGLWPGKELALPGVNSYMTVLNLPLLFQRALEAVRAVPGDVATNGRLLRHFTAAATAYHKPLLIEPTGKSTTILLRCGDSFLGLLMPLRLSDEEIIEQQGWAAAWPARLDGPARTLRQTRDQNGVAA